MTGPHPETESPEHSADLGGRIAGQERDDWRPGGHPTAAPSARRQRRGHGCRADRRAFRSSVTTTTRSSRHQRAGPGRRSGPRQRVPKRFGRSRRPTEVTEEQPKPFVLVGTRAALAQVPAAAATRVGAGAQRLPAAPGPRRRKRCRARSRAIRCGGHESGSGGPVRRHPGGRDGLRSARGGTRDRGFRVRALLSAGFGRDVVRRTDPRR